MWIKINTYVSNTASSVDLRGARSQRQLGKHGEGCCMYPAVNLPQNRGKRIAELRNWTSSGKEEHESEVPLRSAREDEMMRGHYRTDALRAHCIGSVLGALGSVWAKPKQDP